MSTEKLRRELEALRARAGSNCRGCGYPEYPDREVVVAWGPAEARPTECCEVCAREIPHTVIHWGRR
jgi:hypothetical protein